MEGTERELLKFDTSKTGQDSWVLAFRATSLSFQQLCLDTLTCAALTNNHWRAAEQVKGQMLLHDFTVNIVTFSYVCGNAHTHVSMKVKHFQCLSMMKTGPVSNSTGSLSFFESLWVVLWIVEATSKLSVLKQDTTERSFKYSTEAENRMENP